MQSKISLKRFLLILGIAFFSAIILFLIHSLFRQSLFIKSSQKSVEFVQPPVSLKQVVFGLPIRLKIPKIDVDATIKYVGLTPEGAIDIPKDPADVAWFELGPRPGENNSAIISGHYGWKNDIPAVFDNLHELVKGDKIYIEDEGGVTITFVVRESKTYGENENASAVFDSNDGTSHLNLVTCQGVWNKAKKSYSNRLIVFTDKEIL